MSGTSGKVISADFGSPMTRKADQMIPRDQAVIDFAVVLRGFDKCLADMTDEFANVLDGEALNLARAYINGIREGMYEDDNRG